MNSLGAYDIIASRLGMGITVAIPAAILCINRRLYILASADSVLHYSTVKRREVIIDLAIGIGLPILEMILGLSCYYLYHLCLFSLSTLQRSSLKPLDL